MHRHCLWIIATVAICLSGTDQHGRASSVACYSCSSQLDINCISAPKSIISCPTNHGKGCATRLSPEGAIERGCSEIGLNPHGCRVSELFGTECICHTDKCNSDIPMNKVPASQYLNEYISCYSCSSDSDKGCSYDLLQTSTKTRSCPAQNGCYLVKKLGESGVFTYHRLCFEAETPATYHPPGCYTVFDEQNNSNTEVCVCYGDRCNQNSHTALLAQSAAEPVRGENSSGSQCNGSAMLSATISIVSLVLAHLAT